MVMSSCPHCGKPVRPGTRFCGNCGNAVNIPAARPTASASKSSDAAAEIGSDESLQAGWLPCPHCGKPVRPGAKFCHSCGQAILAEVPGEPVPVAAVAAVEATSPVKPLAEHEPVSVERNAKAQASKKRSGRTAIPVIIAGLIMICVIAIAGGYIYLRDPFNLFTGGPLALVSETESAVPPVSQTAKPSMVSSAIPATLTATPTKMLISTITPTARLIDTAEPTNTSSPPEVLLVEDFNGALNEQWTVWLVPNSPYRPKIDTGPGENFLFLMADENPGDAGITSRAEIPNVPGLDIQYIGQLKDDLPGHVMILDWDPVDVERGPLSTLPGEIHLEIWRDRLVFDAATGESEPCQSEIVGNEQHSYRVVIEEDRDLALFVDGAQDPVCVLDTSTLETEPGLLTFTGVGWITKVQVTAPAD